MKNAYVVFPSVVALVLVALLSSCGTKQPLPTDEQRQEARREVPCIVVLPVETKINSDQSITYQKAATLENGAAFMDSLIQEQMIGRNNVRILSSRQFTSLIPENFSARIDLLKKVGSELKCNAVLSTTLQTYRQRVGGSYGADSPASVAFSFRLYNTADGSVIWSSMFKETQRPAMSNIMSLGSGQSRGLTWLTVEELVELGITEQVKECPYL